MENKIKAVKLSNDELENVSGGSSKTTVSGVTCVKCGATINGTAYEHTTGTYKCAKCHLIFIPQIL